MSIYREMAIDAGASPNEIDQMAAYIEQQHWERHQAEQAEEEQCEAEAYADFLREEQMLKTLKEKHND